MNVGIISVGSYIPTTKVSNDDLSQKLDTSDEWIYSHTGIKSRHIATDNETCSWMGTLAAKKAIKKAGLKKDDIGFIILATITPDYKDFPATANLVQDNLALENVGAMDIKAACTGFVYALEIGRGLILGGTTKYVLVIGSEKISSIINWNDRSTAVLFGDGAGAAILGAYGDGERGIRDSVLRSDGSGAKSLCIPAGGTATPIDLQRDLMEQSYLTMDGRQVYNFAVRANTDILQELLTRNNLTADDIDYIVPHQANFRIIAAAAKRLKIPLEKYYLNIEEFANTSSASIPLALDEMDGKGLLQPGMKIMTVGFGAGLTYGGNYIIW